MLVCIIVGFVLLCYCFLKSLSHTFTIVCTSWHTTPDVQVGIQHIQHYTTTHTTHIQEMVGARRSFRRVYDALYADADERLRQQARKRDEQQAAAMKV